MPKKTKVENTESKEEKIEKSSSSESTSSKSSVAEHKSSAFTSKDLDLLSENEHKRFLPNGKKVGHAVIIKNSDGSETAIQYPFPQRGSPDTPEMRPLIDIEAIDTKYKHHRFTAVTPTNKTQMYAKRFIDLTLGEENGEKPQEMKIALFSPKADNREIFWGSNSKTQILKETSKKYADLNNPKKLKIKGGKDCIIEPESVLKREEIKTRKPDQNTVMQMSAKDAYEQFFNEMTKDLTAEMKERMRRAINADIKKAFESNYRPEWLHAKGFWATPMSEDPQVEENLGAAPKWANTEMMVCERIAKWFALNAPEAFVKIKPKFEMLLDSDLIKKIDFEVFIKEKARFIKLLQDIDPFASYPLFRKGSDIAIGTGVAYDLLHDVKPTSTQKVLPAGTGLAKATEDKLNYEKYLAESKTSATHSAKPKPKKTENTAKYEESVVQILTTRQEPDYDKPWAGTQIVYSAGTGLVVSHEDKLYVLTNAHCVQNSAKTRVRLANDNKKKYEATIKRISYQCDLALLEIDNPEFLKAAKPVQLGEMAKIKQKVYTVGFPIGGDEISYTKGIVSRIEVRHYEMGHADMLQVQVDAAINHGNSGGPVFCNDKVIGVAFQGDSRGEALGYMIPIPVIKHFLHEALTKKEYKGFPILPIETQILQNSAIRESLHMKDEQSGILITSIDLLSDAYKKLKPNDVLIEIDGLPITNEGTVDVPEVGKCLDLNHVTHMKYVGDTVALKVLRTDPETHKSTIINLNVTLDSIPYSTEVVSEEEHDKMPTYYINSGISFMPVTRNWLESGGSDLEDVYFADKGCKLDELPKKFPDEQFIVINEIFDCEETDGYDVFRNKLIKEINGKSINNIRDVINAIESNTDKNHTIVTKENTRIVVKRMSAAENASLLNLYHIHHDRSADLRESALMHESKEEKREELPKAVPVNSLSNNSSESSSSKPRRLHDDEEKNLEDILRSKTIGGTPGQKSYRAKLVEMEEKYKNMEDDSSDADYEPSSDSESSGPEDDTEIDLDTYDTKKKSKVTSLSSHRNRLFHGSHTRSFDRTDEETHAKRQTRSQMK